MGLMLPSNIAKRLPTAVQLALGKMEDQVQVLFADDYKRKHKSMSTAYVLLILLSPLASFLYLGRIGLFWWFILVSIITAGFGAIAWYFLEIFLTAKRVRYYNEELAIKILRDQKMLAA